MNESVYAVVAYIARYWFALLAVVIVWRAIIWMRKDADRVSRAQRRLPDAGFIGEWVVVASDVPSTPEGLVLRASRDGWIGSARACDVRLKDAAVPARAARFFLLEDGLHVQPLRRDSVMVDGEEVQREAVLRHGATLTVGGVTLQLRLFAGVLLTGETPVQSGRKRRQRREAVYEEAEEEADEPVDVEALYAHTGPVLRIQEHMPQDDAEDIIIEEDVRVELPKPALTIRSRRNRRQ